MTAPTSTAPAIPGPCDDGTIPSFVAASSSSAPTRPAPATAVEMEGAARSRRRAWPAALLMVLLGADAGAVAALGLARIPQDLAAPGGLALWGGRMTGLLAEVLVLGMVLLATRLPLLEQSFGQDRLLRWHRWLAPTVLVLMVAHPLLLAAAATRGWWGALLSLGSSTLDAVAGTALFLLASAVSVRVVKRRLPYEGWHLLHLTLYGAVVLAFLHQLGAGSAVLQGTLVRTWWLVQLVTVLSVAVTHRIAVPLWRSACHRLRVTEITHPAPGVVSVTVTGRNLALLGARGGQFLVWRFLDRSHWWRAHPFSLSAAVRADTMRLTARQVGDGTRDLSHLRVGTRVLVEGPYGVLTSPHPAQADQRPLLLIGAGLGIAPLRALLEDLPPHADTVLLHRASATDRAVLHDELTALTADRPATRLHLITGRRGAAGDPHRPLGSAQLQALVPDLTSRDVYLCGPPALTRTVLADLRALGVPAGQLHHESFEL